MRDFRSYSFWLEDAGEPLTPRPGLARSADVDVAILGAGFSGLWTAYYLLHHEPALRVAVVEKQIAGFGASGRNGGWCSPNFPLSAGALEKRFGAEAARNLLLAMRDSVDEVGRVCGEEQIDARFHKGGVLTLRPMNDWGLPIATKCSAAKKPRNAFASPMCTADCLPVMEQACIRRAWCAAWRERWRRAAELSMSRRR